jgi:hypothetical protein
MRTSTRSLRDPRTSEQLAFLRGLLPAAVCLLAFGCSGGGGGGGGGGTFQVADLNVTNGQVWFINRPIIIGFSDAVDFNTVSLSTINIRQVTGAPSAGEFFQPLLANGLVDTHTVVFQPLCPVKADYSDAGLKPGGIAYEIKILGADSGQGLTVRSASGTSLAFSETRTFTTPDSTALSVLFFDTKSGAPAPVVRQAGSTTQDATYVEIGSDPNNRLYFERQSNGSVILEGGALLPLNLLSDPAQHVSLLIAFDQAVDPSVANISSQRLRWEYEDPLLSWTPLETVVVLEQNCSTTGALVRIDSAGILPPGTSLRAVVTPEFRDIVGEANSLSQDSFAPADTVLPPPVLADSVEEEFDVGGTQPGSHEDVAPTFGEPVAEWGNGELISTFNFTGTGGNGGDFDWQIPAGQVFILDTTSTVIAGGPNYVPTTQQVVINGVLDVRNMRVNAGATLKVQGPNRLLILATGKIEILGKIELSGIDNKGVATLNTTNIPEPGAAGVAGGGKGGTGNPLTNISSPRGGNGFGAFQSIDGGGQGGETGYQTAVALQFVPDCRRGAGGGGGQFGPGQPSPFGPGTGTYDQSFIGLDGENGFDNRITGCSTPPLGATTNVNPPKGGALGPAPFSDLDTNNDFLGAYFDSNTNILTLGELQQAWAGAGGGGGGSAAFTNGQSFPMIPFDCCGVYSDEKGAGGGGGGGSLTVLALGDIMFGPAGGIAARGGTGGGGENEINFNRVGGGSGGGSGGHVILQTASQVDFSLYQQTGTPPSQAIIVTGSEGGAGKNDVGGASTGTNGSFEKPPTADACPAGYPTVAPNNCLGLWDGAGGDGSPGIIQLHTPNGLGGGDIKLPPGKTLANLCKPTPVHATANERLVPTFGRTSRARSIWIPLGRGGLDPNAVVAPFYKPSTWEFGDVDANGLVQTTNGIVNTQAPLLTGTPVVFAPTPGLPSVIDSAGFVMAMDATALIGSPQEYLLQNMGLLEHFVLQLTSISTPSNFKRFDVVSGTYDPNAAPPRLTLTVSNELGSLKSFVTGAGNTKAELIPSYFRIRTDGLLDALPSSASVQIGFQATVATSAGVPDESQAVPVPPGPDPNALNGSPLNPDFRFFRFEVRFDIDALGNGLTPNNPLPSVEFLRIPFRF